MKIRARTGKELNRGNILRIRRVANTDVVTCWVSVHILVNFIS